MFSLFSSGSSSSGIGGVLLVGETDKSYVAFLAGKQSPVWIILQARSWEKRNSANFDEKSIIAGEG